MSIPVASQVLVVAGTSDSSALTTDAIAAIERAGGNRLARRRDLDPGRAAEWSIPSDRSSCALLKDVRAAISAAPLDANTVETAHRRKRLLVADMDSTIIEQECIDEMAGMLGLKPRIAAITERAMRGELGFEAALMERLALLAGLPEEKLQQVFDQRITVMPGAQVLVRTMRRNGAYTALVSGGFSFFTNRVARLVGFDVDRSNTLDLVDHRLTGKVIGPILGKEAKLAALQQYTNERQLDAADTLAVGDGANDLAMIKAAGLGVAYRAKPIVAAEAAAAVAHGDLTSLLYLQGYARSEFVV